MTSLPIQNPFAHSADSDGVWHSLSDHLAGVAELAAQFATDFGGETIAHYSGLLHDFGKLRDEFQSYLRGKRGGGVDTHHAVYGSAFAHRQNALIPSFVIAGHHAGLYNRGDWHGLTGDERKYHLDERLNWLERKYIESIGAIPEPPQEPSNLHDKWSIEFFIRMIFSCLVDADFLDTESHYESKLRPITQLRDVIDNLVNQINLERDQKSRGGSGELHELRNRIFDQCLYKAASPTGFLTLTAPTGAGKTLASMAFALNHAQHNNLNRVIVVIPYLSIIEQNAKVYRDILDPNGSGIVIEHHSAVEVANEDGGDEKRSDLEQAAENWDAPIIVTTSVQFIESLFAARTTKCRKLHNIAKSVVIFDEVQTLPTHLLNPLLNVIHELKRNYGTSFLFMTATQPAFRKSFSLTEGFEADEVTEITEETGKIFSTLNRASFSDIGTIDWAELAERIAEHEQVLCVVNVRKDARRLWELVGKLVPEDEKSSVVHLSSSMCPAHRLKTIDKIRCNLKNEAPCRVISTQVVEAGVDIDFPVVYRAHGPLDSIVQAAGRCNREGERKDSNGLLIKGEAIIFTPVEASYPLGVYNIACQVTRPILDDQIDDLGLNPDLFGEYFDQLFSLCKTDYAKPRDNSIQEDRAILQFRTVAKHACVIREEGVSIIVPYGDGKELISEIRDRVPIPGRPRFSRTDLRRLQRYMVGIRKSEFNKLDSLKMLSPLLRNIELYVIDEGCYHNELGLVDQKPQEDYIGV